jgi:membrane protease YdiL (CAAX protease family)
VIAVVGFAAGLVLSAVTSEVAATIVGYRIGGPAPLPVAVTAADVSGLWVGLVAACVYWARTRGGGSVVEAFGYRVGTWWDVPAGAALGLACQFGLVPLLYLPFEHFDRNLSQQLSQPAQQETGAAHTDVALVILLAVIAVGAPLVEELFFRGLLLRSLSKWFGPVVGVTGSGLLFGLAHFEPVQLAGLAVFGVVLAIVACKLGRLGPTIAAHISFNAAAVVTSVHLR